MSEGRRGRGERAAAVDSPGNAGTVLVVLGVVAVLAGFVGILWAGFAGLASMALFGWLLLIGGAVGLVQALSSRRGEGFWPALVVAALNIAAGVVVLRHPTVVAEGLLMLAALLFLAGGLFRIGGAFTTHGRTMVWLLLLGLFDLLLGLLVLAEWPNRALATIGTFLSLAVLVDGLALIGLGLGMRRILGAFRTPS
ncbi:DUF308 domain-containing protein [Allostreptomyces psammosilenae]|uniref:Uncharacterized membrane protein HdeD (DUF308 family) n=1 Tax=Allostreptomyces psammosilenae TaxID=1892865 RepID=A0A853AA16_9ACTN|nr:DUF308 domain-containing protein [Allostreptomyces psammosilenae]NYI07358.1 uncharacterized membrane protein HdeD (DUF308 family) [Allostreptomyces psammosilenae]